MYVTKTQGKALLRELASSLTGQMKDRAQVLSALLKQDDWSFVIKTHALIESAITGMLVERIGEPSLMQIVERLPLSDSQTGKIVVAKQLLLLDDGHRRFIRWFSELRNQLVHKFENVSFTFEAKWKTLDANQRKNWREAILYHIHDENTRKDWDALVETKTKFAVFMAIFMLISECTIQEQQRRSLSKLTNASEETMKTFDPNVTLSPVTKRSRTTRRIAKKGGVT